MPKPSEIFRKNLKFFLEEKVWKQADLARAMGVKPQMVNKYFAEDVEPRIDSLSDIAKAFGIQPYELLLETDQEALPRVAIEVYRGTIELQAKQIDRLIAEISELRGQINSSRIASPKRDYEPPPDKPKK